MVGEDRSLKATENTLHHIKSAHESAISRLYSAISKLDGQGDPSKNLASGQAKETRGGSLVEAINIEANYVLERISAFNLIAERIESAIGYDHPVDGPINYRG